MRYKIRVFMRLVALSVFCLSASVLFPFGFSKDGSSSVNLQTFCISDFGDTNDVTEGIVWRSKYSRFQKYADEKGVYCTNVYVEGKPVGLDKRFDESQKYALALKASFIKKGYNWIELYPVKVQGSVGQPPDPNTQGEVTTLPLQGVVKSLDLWIWGGNYDYDFSFHLLDYKGYLHIVEAGNIEYVGWKIIQTAVPPYIPQAETQVPFLKPIRLVAIKLLASPEERVDQFYAYFDYMQVQTDVYMERFNGDDLAENVW